ncbi:GNAT family N-acetyltransferase [Streptacidiphilus melanogenes]|uniref:GNAT family N-acetyltransferase n=1 Tax=Streptacidiphilus melanogenes TaxID=411235 RepID=UPI000693833C|nr:GNAT family N-acetyltransferase [Streptacidiphilus melanogenes]
MSRQIVATGTTMADPIPTPRSSHGLLPAAGESVWIPTPLGTVTRLASVADLDAVQDLHARCSLVSRAARYMVGKRELAPAEWRHFTHPARATTWLTSPEVAPGRIVAMTNLIAHHGDRGALDLGLLIEDGFQGQGLGTALARIALGHARLLGGHRLTASTGRANRRMIAILHRLGATDWHYSGPDADTHVHLDGAR